MNIETLMQYMSYILAGIGVLAFLVSVIVQAIKEMPALKISTHILTKRMTAILNKNNLFKIAYYINNKHFISIVDIFFHFHIYF